MKTSVGLPSAVNIMVGKLLQERDTRISEWVHRQLPLADRLPKVVVLFSVAIVVAATIPYSIAQAIVALCRTTTSRAPASKNPPVNAAFLFYLFLDAHNCDAFVGDLEERYRLIRKKFGRRRANLWYWSQTVLSLAPIVWAWTKKVAVRPVAFIVTWALAKGLVGHDSWLAAVMELLKITT